MSRYDIILLDADMTLLDFERSEREALRKILLRCGLTPTEEVETTYSRINHALWDAFVAEIQPYADEFAAFMQDAVITEAHKVLDNAQ